jgi:hypothetical protein
MTGKRNCAWLGSVLDFLDTLIYVHVEALHTKGQRWSNDTQVINMEAF